MRPQEPQPPDPAARPVVFRLHLSERVDPEAAAALWSLILNGAPKPGSEPPDDGGR